ncbi:hypothetical protein GPA10_22400 [Streptomyces sp. p1417]|uniref:Uncharacterized protein n=1 Tax=Streptomyces typhae TaxID=2681492 RepID=A0A6L6X164_9ACTN|nr:hypothetical protein [Streptomyces typhae]MVO87437.1 hypothetical protein [Streptomyces typhae]
MIVRIVCVDSWHVTYQSTDDIWDSAEADIFRTLSEATSNWRPATEAETAEWHARFRPGPQNWN